MDYSKYFDIIDQFEEKKEEVKINTCCENPEIEYNYVLAIRVCKNCSIVIGNFDTEEVIVGECLNPRYNLSTKMSGYSRKYKHLNRLQNWKTKEEIKELNANDRYNEIKEICEKFTDNKDVATTAVFFYKDIYIDDNVCSRGNIRKANYLYCIYKAMVHYEEPICIFNLLKSNKLTIKNFNDSLKNIKGDIYIHKDLDKYREKLNINYDCNISQSEFIVAYNKVLSIAKDMFKKINFTNIIIGTLIYLSPNKDIIKFCKVFNIKEKTYHYGENLLPLK